MGKQSKQKSSSYEQWGEPQWSPEHNQWFMLKFDAYGTTIDSQWIQDPRQPRAPAEVTEVADVDDLTQGVGNIALHEQESPYTDPDVSEDLAHGDAPASPEYTLDRKGKGKMPAASYYTGHGHGQPSTDDSHFVPHQTPYEPAHEDSDAQDQFDQSYDDLNESQFQQALRQSRNETFGQDTEGEPSSAAYDLPSEYGDTGHYDSQYATPFDPVSVAQPTDEYPEAEQYGAATPRAGSPIEPSSLYNMGENYRVERSVRFQPGEVFKILWSEPRGAQANEHMTERPNKEDFYVGIRRFIVIASDMGHSTCVPILTYEKKGCNKKGVRASKHGIIYERRHKPRLLPKEGPLGYNPVAVDIYAEDEKLAKESRVNYSKLVTIEHNVKVYFIGSVSDRDFHIVSNAIDECWQAKQTHRKKHSKK